MGSILSKIRDDEREIREQAIREYKAELKAEKKKKKKKKKNK